MTVAKGASAGDSKASGTDNCTSKLLSYDKRSAEAPHQLGRVSIQQNIWANKNTESHFSPVQSSTIHGWLPPRPPPHTWIFRLAKGILNKWAEPWPSFQEAESGSEVEGHNELCGHLARLVIFDAPCTGRKKGGVVLSKILSDLEQMNFSARKGFPFYCFWHKFGKCYTARGAWHCNLKWHGEVSCEMCPQMWYSPWTSPSQHPPLKLSHCVRC